MQSYLDVRPNIEETLFCHLNGKPLSRYQVSSMLRKVIRFIGLNDEEYNTHSFRIGAATTASLMGKSDDEIRKVEFQCVFKIYKIIDVQLGILSLHFCR